MPKHPSIPQAQHYAHVVAVILLLSKVILLCSRCVEKGLVYITIAAPSGRQLSFYSACTSINIYLSCNV